MSSNVAGVTGGQNGSSPSSVPNRNTLKQQDFLKLLTAQMQYQDPFGQSTDPAQFFAQMVQFTSLETLQKISDSIGTLSQKLDYYLQGQQETSLSAALNLVGHKVSALLPDGRNLEGTVTGVKVKEGSPALLVDGKEVTLGSLQEVW